MVELVPYVGDLCSIWVGNLMPLFLSHISAGEVGGGRGWVELDF